MAARRLLWGTAAMDVPPVPLSLPGADESSSNDLWLDRRIDTAAAAKEGYKVVYRRTKEEGKMTSGDHRLARLKFPSNKILSPSSRFAKKLRDVCAHAQLHMHSNT